MFPFNAFKAQQPNSCDADIPSNFDRTPVVIEIHDTHPVKSPVPSEPDIHPRITFTISQGEHSSVYCLYGNRHTRDQVGVPVGHKYFPTGSAPDTYLELRKRLHSYDAKPVQELIKALNGKAGSQTRLIFSDRFKRAGLGDERNRGDLFAFLDNAHDHILHINRTNGIQVRAGLAAVRNRLGVSLGREIK